MAEIDYSDLESLVFTCYEAGKITVMRCAELLGVKAEKVDSLYSAWKLKRLRVDNLDCTM